MTAAGGKLESPKMEFKDDADSMLMQNLLVSAAQHQRQKNAEQTQDRMRGRILNGRWPFIACIGLKHQRKPGEGSVLVRDEPFASIIQEGLEGYASSRFQTQAEVKRFFEAYPIFPKDRHGQVRNQLVNDILTKPLYAGYLQAPPSWGLPLLKGKHEGLIDWSTSERIQACLQGGSYAPARADLNEDFPLRGTVACDRCGKPLTACWSTGKSGTKHPYYFCFAKGCDRYRKSIKREQLETAFVMLLESLKQSVGCSPGMWT